MKRSMLWLLTLPLACTPDPPAASSTGTVHLAIASEALFDVTHIEFEVMASGGSCDDVPIASKIVALEEEALPQHLLPPGVDGEHPFADGLFVLPVGDVLVCATPLKLDAPPTRSDFCPTVSKEVTVTGGSTNEIVLLSACGGPDNGGLDVVAGLNTNPHIDDLTIVPSKFIRTCEEALITVTAHDLDDDAMIYTWNVDAQPAGTPPGLSGSGPTVTFSPHVAGDYQLSVAITDEQGTTANLSFPMHVSGAPCDPPSASWMAGAGGIFDERIMDVHANGGEIAIGGFLYDKWPVNLSQTGVVRKLDAAGTPLWVTYFGSDAVIEDVDQVTGVAVADNGNVYATGVFDGTVDFGCGAHTASGVDVFLVKLHGLDGDCIWSETFGGTGTDLVAGMAVSYEPPTDIERVTLAGYYSSPSFGVPGFPPLPNAGGLDMFYLKRDGITGADVWHKRAGGTGVDRIEGLAVQRDGAIAITGAYASTAFTLSHGAVSETSPANSGDDDTFVAKLAYDGTPAWIVASGATGLDFGRGIDLDDDGSVLVSGQFWGSFALGGASLTKQGDNDAFVVLLDDHGVEQWSTQANADTNALATRVVFDPFGDARVFGDFAMAANFGGTPLSAGAAEDLFLVALDRADGSEIWALSGGSTGDDEARGLFVDAANVTYIGGAYGHQSGTDFSLAGSTPLPGGGDYDQFWGRLDPN